MTETPNPNIIDADTLTGRDAADPSGGARVGLQPRRADRQPPGRGRALADTPDVWVTGVSPVYETEPVDAPRGLRRSSTPSSWPTPRWPRPGCSTGRWRSRTPSTASAARSRNAPRTLDVDLIVVGDRRSDDDSPAAAAPAGRRARLRAAAVARHRPGGGDPRPRSGRRLLSAGRARAGSTAATTWSSSSSDHRRRRDPRRRPTSTRGPTTTARSRRTGRVGCGRPPTSWSPCGRPAGWSLGWLLAPGGGGAGRHRPAGLVGPAGGAAGWWRPSSRSRGGRPTGPCRSAASGWSRTARSTGWCSAARARWSARWWPVATPGTRVSWVGDPAELAGQRILRSAVAVLAGIAMVVFALLLERACQVRRDRDDTGLRSRPAAQAARG